MLENRNKRKVLLESSMAFTKRVNRWSGKDALEQVL
jgi:hypothetical protein